MKDIQDLDVVTTVELDNTENGDKPVYHALYASQLYGTFFGVYGQFKTEPAKGKDDKWTVKSLHLRILNLQGVLNIGFSNYKPGYKKTTNDDGTEKRTISLGVRAASGIQETTLEFKENEPLEITKGIRHRIVIERVLFPMSEVASGGMAAKTDLKLGTPNQKSPYFDTEFHYRNGADHFYQVHREGMADKSDMTDGTLFEPLWPGIKCVPSHIYLLYTGNK